VEDKQQQPDEVWRSRYRLRRRHKRVSVYAQVDDLQTTLDKVEKLGGKTILRQPKSRVALSWPCSPIRPAMGLGSF